MSVEESSIGESISPRPFRERVPRRARRVRVGRNCARRMRPGERTIQRSRDLRQDATLAEQLAWKLLRNRDALGIKFRRQHPIGNYVVDFYCPDYRLAVELDGSIHSQPRQIREDKKKERFLRQQGIRVLRIPNGWVLEDPEGFVKKVMANLPSPVPLRGTPSP